MPIACNILDSFIAQFGSETNYLQSEGALVSQDDTEYIF